jgi:chorismate mutase/prephenate dehydratase
MEEQRQPDLNELRAAIDELDDELVRLLNRRSELSVQVGRTVGSDKPQVFAPEREAQVLARVAMQNTGPLEPEHLEAIYREILSASRSLQRTLKVAYLGPEATFTHQAALGRFGSAAEYVPVPTIPEIYTEVARGATDLGVMPAENTTEGPVLQTLDMLAEGELRISGEITIPVAQFLLSRSPMERITRVYSHPQAVAQCQRWLAANLPGRDVLHISSTSKAAQLAAEEEGAAAISTQLAAEVYGLDVIAGNIQDFSSNYTRFYVVGPRMSERPTGRDKSAIMFSIRDRVGALRDMLEVFGAAGVNLTSIHSRPSRRRAWDYVFFVELSAHANDPTVSAVLKEAEQHCVFLKVLGAWPVDQTP